MASSPSSVFRAGALSSLGSESGRPSSTSAGLYQNGKLTAEGRAKLQRIKEREALKDHLVTKYEAKFGKKESKLSATAPAQPHALQQEQEQRQMQDEAAAAAAEAAQSRRAASSEGQTRQVAPSPSQASEWAAIVEHNKVGMREYERKRKELIELNKANMKRDLDEQKHAMLSSVEQAKKEKEDDLAKTLSDVEHWKDEERRKKETRMRYIMEDKQIRQMQIEDTIRRRQEERESNLRLEERLVERIQQEIVGEKMKQKQKKTEHLEAMHKIMEDNERQEKIKHEQLLQQQAEEVLLQKAYIALLDKQDRARHQALQDILAKQEASTKVYSTSVGASLATQAAEDSARAAALQEEFNRQRSEKDRLKAEMKAKAENDCKEMQFFQMDLRRQAKEREIEENKQYAIQVKALAARAQQEEQERKARLKSKKQQNKSDLDEQTQALEARRIAESFAMSDEEKKYNSKLLQAVQNHSVDIKFDAKSFQKTPIVWKALSQGAPF